MEGSNLLSGGVEELNEIKENLLELRGNQANSATQLEEEEKLEKNIKSLEKEIAEEIQTTVKKRRSEIDDTYDQQIAKIKDRTRKIKERRTRKKSSKVSERINAETASLHAGNNRLKLEAGTIISQKNIPAFCNTKLYYALYSPSCFTDILIIIATILATLMLIPSGVYYLVLAQEKVLYLIITYVITVLLFGGLYVITDHLTKERFLEDIRHIKGIRGNIRANNKKINSIKSNIKKDRDESSYGLQNYDEELAQLEKEEDDLLAQKKDALETFENTTRQVIASEIQGAHEEKLSALRTENDNVSAEVKKTQDKIKALTLKIASEYEPFLGKDLITLDRLESLSNIILAGNAANISEAVAFYRQNMNRQLPENLA